MTKHSGEPDVTPVVVCTQGDGFRTEITAGGHEFVADEPLRAGGTNAGPTPYDYLIAALGACMAMTVRWYATRRGWPLDEVTVRLRHRRDYAKDCESCEREPVGIDEVLVDVELAGALTDEQRRRLLAIAGRCPVKQSLAAGVRVRQAAGAPPTAT